MPDDTTAQAGAATDDRAGGDAGPVREPTDAEAAVFAVYESGEAFGRTRLATREATARFRPSGRAVSQRRFYSILRDPWCRAQIRRIGVEAVGGIELTDIIGAAIATARKVGREGHADRKLLLEMAGLYRPADGVGRDDRPGAPASITTLEIGPRLERALVDSQARRAELSAETRVTTTINGEDHAVPDKTNGAGLNGGGGDRQHEPGES